MLAGLVAVMAAMVVAGFQWSLRRPLVALRLLTGPPGNIGGTGGVWLDLRRLLVLVAVRVGCAEKLWLLLSVLWVVVVGVGGKIVENDLENPLVSSYFGYWL